MNDQRLLKLQCVVEESGKRCKNGVDIFFQVPVPNPEAQVGGFICPEHDQVYAWASQVFAGDMLVNERSLARNIAFDEVVAKKGLRSLTSGGIGWKEVKKFGKPINDTLLIRAEETKVPSAPFADRKAAKKYFTRKERKKDD